MDERKTVKPSISTASDVVALFKKLCSEPLAEAVNQSDNSYGFMKIPAITNPEAVAGDIPKIEQTRAIGRLLDLIPALNKNLDYRCSADDWRSFYCFPTAEETKETAKEQGVDISFVANASENASSNFRDRVLSIAHEAKTNATTNFVFLSGTTGVGKTTFVKFHTRTQKSAYLNNDVIIARLKFRDLEKRISTEKHAEAWATPSETTAASPLKIFEEHLIDCLFRDLIDSYNITSLDKKTPIKAERRKRLEESILEAEAIIELLGELTKSDAYLLKRIFDLSEGEQRKISSSIKISALIMAVKAGFHFTVFLDGFDAIEPETIKLDRSEESNVFLACLEAVALGSFSGSGEAYQFLRDTPIVFVVSARPITIAQIKLSLQDEVDFRQVVHHSEFIAPSRVFDIIRSRLRVRAAENGHSIGSRDVELFEAIIQRCLLELRHEYPSIKPGGFIRLFNHNVRDKIGFLLLLAGFFIRRLAVHIYEEPDVREQLRDGQTTLERYITDVPLLELSIGRYELEKILFLNRNEKFSNYFIYDLHNDSLSPSPDKGSFDNLYNYRLIHTFSDGTQTTRCPLIVKREILRYVIAEGEAQHGDMIAWLEERFPMAWSRNDIKLLIRGGMIAGEYDSGVIIYSATDKGEFIFGELQYRYAYFERACVASSLPKFVRNRLHRPIETSGGQWGRASIINTGVFIRYMRMIEERQNLPEEDRLSELLSDAFADTVQRLALAGLSGTYPSYASELEDAFEVAFA